MTRIPDNATLRQQTVDCGRCSKAHGPYWFWELKDKNGKVRTGYIGKHKERGKELRRGQSSKKAP